MQLRMRASCVVGLRCWGIESVGRAGIVVVVVLVRWMIDE